MHPKYQAAIDVILSADDPKTIIRKAWDYPESHPQGCLFAYCTRTNNLYNEQGQPYGCLTQMRNNHHIPVVACSSKLAEQIRNDDRIPKSVDDISPTQECLAVFGEWQTKIDEYCANEVS